MKKTLAPAFALCFLAVLPACEEPEPDDHGAVFIELQRSASEPTSPFTGTGYIVAFLDYKECLAEFYTTEHPEYQQEGIEGGSKFMEWADGKLCDPDNPEYPDTKVIPSCTVSDMSQTINTQGAQDTTFLRVEYDLASDDIEGLHLPFGPLPKESLAGCSPLVQLKQASVQGFDGMKNQIWQIASFDNDVARVGQGASIQIFVERSD
jgi:hypothetical protein